MSTDTKADTLDVTPENTVNAEELQAQKAAEALELKLLKERADQMGITYHPSIGLATLYAKVASAMNELALKTTPAAEPKEEGETESAKNARLQAEANKLIRVVVNCMNPSKQQWEGEIITVRNRVIGTIKKFVPFNLDTGYHIPNAIYENLLERKCQIFYTVVDPRTKMKTRRGKLINEFNIVVLPPLTKKELEELATQQAVSNSID